MIVISRQQDLRWGGDFVQNTEWWKQTVVYQIYPRSFKDSNGDGIGDIPGIIEKLDYLKELGIGAVWLSPVCKSPQADNGYDISDYQDIDPIFGSLSDMERLIKEAADRDIRIMMDLVLNHTSDEHPWFMEAKKDRENPYHDYYVWRDGTKDAPPNDLKAAFGGSAWEWVPECRQYYLHQFAVKQPDLNWDNPKVRKEIYKMIQWWMDKGIGGFRLDVIDLIAKEPDRLVLAEGEHLHTYIQEMSRETFQKAELITVGEAWSATVDTAKKFSNPDGSELSMVFQFEHMVLDQQKGKEKWDLEELPFTEWQQGLHGKGWNSLFLENHDLPRSVSRFGNDGKYRVRSAKMLATLIHGMEGTPYIYQGEELGMTNVRYDIEEYRDIETLNLYKERMEQGYRETEIMQSIYAKSRDNARTPMQWDDSPFAGFTTGTPWIRCNPNYNMIHARAQMIEEDSVFHYYQSLIRLRKQERVIQSGKYEPFLEENSNVFAYIRRLDSEQILVICNFTDREQHIKELQEWENGKLLLGNYIEEHDRCCLRPYEAKIVKEDAQCEKE